MKAYTLNIFDLFVRNRIACSWLFGAIILAIIIFSAHPWENASYISLVFRTVGYLFLVTATIGRIWCAIYIGGMKNNKLITEGPYSIVRNPLYVFSFIGAMGLGISAENPLATILITILFVAFYPRVVLSEEKKLVSLFGEEFAAYAERVPRWIPKPFIYREPREYLVRPRLIRREMLDATLFLWAFLAFEIIEKLRHMNIIPVLWKGIGIQ